MLLSRAWATGRVFSTSLFPAGKARRAVQPWEPSCEGPESHGGEPDAGARSPRVSHEWPPRSAGNRPGPPWPGCGVCWSERDSASAPSQNATAASEPPPSPHTCSQSLSSCHRATPDVCHTGLLPLDLPTSRLSSSLRHGCWPLESGR